MKYWLLLFFLFLITSVSGQQITSFGSDIDNGYRFLYATGNESCYATVQQTGRLRENIQINVRTALTRVCQVCDDEGCTNRRIDPPSTLNVRDYRGTVIAQLPLNVNRFNFNVDDALRRDLRFIKFGEESIFILGDTSYNSTDTNVTQESGFAHLQVSDQGIYGSLRGYYSFDMDNASVAYDLTTNNADGIYIAGINTCNNPSLSGFIGCAYSYNASNLAVSHRIDLGTPTSLFLGEGNFTLTAWANADTLTAQSVIFHRGPSNSMGAHLQQYQLMANASGNLIFSMGNGTTGALGFSNITSGPGLITNDTWYFVAVSVNQTSGVTVYLNGSVVATGQKTFVGLAPQNSTFIGAGTGAIGASRWAGTIDEVMFFNTSLTTQDINSIYTNQTSRFFTNGNLRFDNIDLQGNNTVNIILGSNLLLNSNISAQFNSGPIVTFANGSSLYNYNVTGSLSNATLRIILLAGNETSNPFYTPYIFGNITLDSSFVIIPYENFTGRLQIGYFSCGIARISLNRTNVSAERGCSQINTGRINLW